MLICFRNNLISGEFEGNSVQFLYFLLKSRSKLACFQSVFQRPRRILLTRQLNGNRKKFYLPSKEKR